MGEAGSLAARPWVERENNMTYLGDPNADLRRLGIPLSIPCAHHWDIETTPGKFSPGKCRLCGEVKEDFRNGFANDYEEYNEARKLMRTAPRSEPTNVEGPVRTKSNRMSRYE